MPDFVVGVVGFLLLTFAAVQLLRTSEERWLHVVLLLSTIGAGVAGVLGYVEVVLIHCICPVCLTAYIADALALFLAVMVFRLRERAVEVGPEGRPAS